MWLILASPFQSEALKYNVKILTGQRRAKMQQRYSGKQNLVSKTWRIQKCRSICARKSMIILFSDCSQCRKTQLTQHFYQTLEYKHVNKCLWQSIYIYKLHPFQVQAGQTNYSSHWFACIVVLSVLCTRCTIWFLSGFSVVLWSDSNYLLACT